MSRLLVLFVCLSLLAVPFSASVTAQTMPVKMADMHMDNSEQCDGLAKHLSMQMDADHEHGKCGSCCKGDMADDDCGMPSCQCEASFVANILLTPPLVVTTTRSHSERTVLTLALPSAPTLLSDKPPII